MSREIKEFDVPGISCSGCVRGITKALGAASGVESVEGDAETKRVRVEYDGDQINEDDIRATMKKAGFIAS